MKIYKPIVKKLNSHFLMVRVFFREIPKIMDAQGRTAFQLQDEIKSIGISRELAYLLGFVNHPKHGIPFFTMNNSQNMHYYQVIKDPLMVEFSIMFYIVT